MKKMIEKMLNLLRLNENTVGMTPEDRIQIARMSCEPIYNALSFL